MNPLLTKVIAFGRGVAKTTFPIINTALEVRKNKIAEKLGKATLPHNYWSIIGQVLATAAIIYAFYRSSITIDQLITFLKSIFGF